MRRFSKLFVFLYINLYKTKSPWGGAIDKPPRVLSPFRGGGLCASVTRIAMLAGVFILLLGPPKPDRLKGRGQTK